MSLTPSISEELTSRAPPRPIVAWTAIRTRRPPRSDSSWHQRRKTRKKRKGWRREKKKTTTLFYDSNFMENSISFLWGGGGGAAWKSQGTQLTVPPLSQNSSLGTIPRLGLKVFRTNFPRAPSIAHTHLFLLTCYIFTKFPVIWLEMNKAGLNAYVFFNH